MYGLKCFGIFILLISSFGITHGCTKQNITCSQTTDGFRIQYECPIGSRVTVHQNLGLLAHYDPGEKASSKSEEVIHFDETSVSLKHCQNLTILCEYTNAESHAECLELIHYGNTAINTSGNETRDGFRVQEKGPVGSNVTVSQEGHNSADEDSKTTEISAGGYVGIILGVFFAVLISIRLGCMCCKKKKSGKTWREFFCSTNRCSARTEQRIEEPSETNPHGGGQTDEEENDTLQSVHVDSLDRSSSNGKSVPTKNGNITTPKSNGTSCHQDMNRNMIEDPGVMNSSERQDDMSGMKNEGAAAGGHGDEDEDSERQRLLSNEEAAVQTSDKTGEYIALEDMSAFTPETSQQVCTRAPGTDVESTTK